MPRYRLSAVAPTRISPHNPRHSSQMVGDASSSEAGADTSDCTWFRAFPQNEQRSGLVAVDRLENRLLRRAPGRRDSDGGQDAGITDVDTAPGDELADLALLAPAEGTDPRGGGLLPPPSPPPANTAVLDDLMDALVADAESFAHFTHRCACQVQALDRSAVFRLGSLELVLEIGDPVRRRRGLCQHVLINGHLSTISRQTGSPLAQVHLLAIGEIAGERAFSEPDAAPPPRRSTRMSYHLLCLQDHTQG